MNSLKIFGKYLDQPKLIHKFEKSVPAVLIAGGALYTLHHISHTPDKKKDKVITQSVITMMATIASALAAPKICAKIFKEAHPHAEINMPAKIDEFIKTNKISEESKRILQKAKEKILKPKEIKTIIEEFKTDEAKSFINAEDGLIPDPENIDSKHIFSEIGKLSLLGLIPVLGGISGGILGDALTEKNWKKKIPDKIKEGSYQYLANIFLCNIGAGLALALLEKANIKSKTSRALGMTAGIAITGVIGGSAIANLIGKTFIDPLFKEHHRHVHLHNHHKKLYSERKPELLDVGLHLDDVATVGVMSGLKWIEPALPILYSISGYRAGIGYRNGEKSPKEREPMAAKIIAFKKH